MEPNERNGKRKSKSKRKPKTQCTILKIQSYRRKKFIRILNETLRDHRLGRMARAILCYALSRPSDWKLHSWEMAQEFRCGEWVVRKAMKELVSAEYARLILVRTATGRVTGRGWLIRESPELEWPVSNPRKHALGRGNAL